MRILLAQNLMYVPTHGGANKANRIICELLADRGHDCLVMASAGGAQTTLEGSYLDIVNTAGAEIESTESNGVRFRLRGVSVHALSNPAQLRAELTRELLGRRPDFVVISSEDALQRLLQAAIQICPEKVIYLAHTTMFLPFGPASLLPRPASLEMLRCAAGIVTLSTFMKDYFQCWGGLNAEVLKLPMYGAGPYRNLAGRKSGTLLMVNPCVAKGLSLFLKLADKFPMIPFAAVRSWGTTEADTAALRLRPNIEVLDPVEDIDSVFEHARAVLVPSLCQEGFGLVVVEAMLRGLPVLASNTGGLPEAKLGIEYLLPVTPIEKYTGAFDDRLMPCAVVPEQDVGPWAEAIRDLFGSEDRYSDISRRGQEAALAFVGECSIEMLEGYLQGLSH